MPKSEKLIEQEIRISLSKNGTINFKNDVGMAKTKEGAWIRYGLEVGTSDIIGLTPIKITQDMVGQTVAVFTAVEVKTPATIKKTSAQQKSFIKMVLSKGGFAGVAYDIKSALDIIGK